MGLYSLTLCPSLVSAEYKGKEYIPVASIPKITSLFPGVLDLIFSIVSYKCPKSAFLFAIISRLIKSFPNLSLMQMSDLSLETSIPTYIVVAFILFHPPLFWIYRLDQESHVPPPSFPTQVRELYVEHLYMSKTYLFVY